jgi:hypothetical protein
MVAVFADQIAQTPFVVQCPQASPEPWWKWIIQSAIPVAGGTLIAVWSFVRNRQSEHEQWVRNQKAEHEQWILDQKKVEWRELLDVVNECQLDILIASTPVTQAPARTRDDLVSANLKLLKVDRALDDRVFIDRAILKPLSSKWHIAVKKTEKASQSNDPYVTSVESYVAFKQLIKAVREAAKKDLGIDDGQDNLATEGDKS